MPLALLHYIREVEPKRTLDQAGIEIVVTGVATGSRGNAINESGISLEDLIAVGKKGRVDALNKGPQTTSNIEFIKKVSADILLVATPSDMPSVEEIKAAFVKGMSVITSNKTPVANNFHELMDEAKKQGVCFRFGATVLGGYPPWYNFFESITMQEINEMQIVVNATSGLILTMMLEEGKSFEQGVAKAQELGIAERNPSHDIDGLDTQKKLTILANVLMNAKLTPKDIPTTGIRGVTVDQLKGADQVGKWIQLLGRARRNDRGEIQAEVKPVEIKNPFFTRMRGTSMGLYFMTSVANFGIWLELCAGERAIMATAAGVFEDLLTIVKKL